MARRFLDRQLDVVKLDINVAEPLNNDLVLVLVNSVASPCSDADTARSSNLTSHALKVVAVVRANGVDGLLHFGRS